mmetsp:Transcript_81766/g.249785  ORF Transcript_81766/g.249785 Transcript_81766/m.249785 type:complete len:404 (+) Transcript_81766:600-1811(+)
MAAHGAHRAVRHVLGYHHHLERPGHDGRARVEGHHGGPPVENEHRGGQLAGRPGGVLVLRLRLLHLVHHRADAPHRHLQDRLLPERVQLDRPDHRRHLHLRPLHLAHAELGAPEIVLHAGAEVDEARQSLAGCSGDALVPPVACPRRCHRLVHGGPGMVHHLLDHGPGDLRHLDHAGPDGIPLAGQHPARHAGRGLSLFRALDHVAADHVPDHPGPRAVGTGGPAAHLPDPPAVRGLLRAVRLDDHVRGGPRHFRDVPQADLGSRSWRRRGRHRRAHAEEGPRRRSAEGYLRRRRHGRLRVGQLARVPGDVGVPVGEGLVGHAGARRPRHGDGVQLVGRRRRPRHVRRVHLGRHALPRGRPRRGRGVLALKQQTDDGGVAGNSDPVPEGGRPDQQDWRAKVRP